LSAGEGVVSAGGFADDIAIITRLGERSLLINGAVSADVEHARAEAVILIEGVAIVAGLPRDGVVLAVPAGREGAVTVARGGARPHEGDFARFSRFEVDDAVSAYGQGAVQVAWPRRVCIVALLWGGAL
jgi:hypothetical protein